jgi:hypothetical protein
LAVVQAGAAALAATTGAPARPTTTRLAKRVTLLARARTLVERRPR